MNALHMIHLPLHLSGFNRWAGSRASGWSEVPNSTGSKLVAFDEGRALHHLLAEIFGKGALQPFRLVFAPGSESAGVYAYSSFDSRALLEAARDCATPDALAACKLEHMAAKQMPSEWKEGRRLAFDLRARPVRRLLRPAGAFAKGAELDAFLVEALRRHPEGPLKGQDEQVERETVYVDWLRQRLEGAAVLEHARLVRFSRCFAARKGRASDGPDAILSGELVIKDRHRFADLLVRGVGRHAAYGYGMLLLRHPRHEAGVHYSRALESSPTCS